MLVDCGPIRGYKLRRRNWERFPVAPSSIDALATHAHIDHSGYIPSLMRRRAGPEETSEAPESRSASSMMPSQPGGGGETEAALTYRMVRQTDDL